MYISFYKKNKLLFGLLLFVIFLSFGFELTHFTLSIDEEIAFFHKTPLSLWIKQGRFGIAIIKKLFQSYELVPFWNTFLSVFFLFLSTTYLCLIINGFLKTRISEKTKLFLLFIFGSIFISFPINTVYVSFSTYNFEVSLGILLVTLSFKLFLNFINSNKLLNLILCVLTFTYSISIYQSFICFFICLASFIFILAVINGDKFYSHTKNSLIIILKLFLTILVSVLFYELLNWLFLLKYPSNNYIENLIVWGRIDFKRNILQIINYYQTNIFENTALFFYIHSFIVLILSIVALVINFFDSKVNKLLLVFWFLLFLFSPMLLTVFFGCVTFLRTMQSMSLLFGALPVFIIITFKTKFIRYILFIFFIFVLFSQSRQMNQIFSSDYLRYQQDVYLADTIYERILDMKVDINTHPVVFLGSVTREMTRENIKIENLGHSFFEWDNGNQDRIYYFMRYLGHNIKNHVPFDKDKENQYRKIMPVWPDIDFIGVYDGLIIVNL